MARTSRVKRVENVGQGNLLDGTIEGLDKLVNKPEVLEHDGLKVIKIIIPEHEWKTPKYVDTALDIARKLLPDIRSIERPPWLRPEWQVKRRKIKDGIYE